MAFKGRQFFSGWVVRSLLFVSGMGFATFVLSQSQKAGDIVLVKGDVFILDKNSKVVADPQGKRGRSTVVGQPFFVGETIQTKSGARVKLKFLEGGNEVVLGSETSLLIERASNGSDGKKGTTLNLAKGEVRSDVKTKYSGQGGESYEVKTNNAVAGVRGTVFMMALNVKTGLTSLATSEGKVAFSAVNPATGKMSAPVIVPAGQFSMASATGAAPEAPQSLSKNPELAGKAEALGGSSSEKSSEGEGDKGSGNSGGQSEQKSDSAQSGTDSKQEGGSTTASSEQKSENQGEAKGESKGEAKPDSKSESKKEPASNQQASNNSNGDSGGGSADRAPASESKAAPLSRMTDNSSTSSSSGPSAATGPTTQPMAPPPMIMGEAPAPRMTMPSTSIMGSTGVGSAINGALDAARQATTTVNTLAPPAPPKAIIRIE
jgi:hypothetical protein